MESTFSPALSSILSQEEFWRGLDFYQNKILSNYAEKNSEELVKLLRYSLKHDSGQIKFCLTTLFSDLDEFATLTQDHNNLPRDRKTLLRLLTFSQVLEDGFLKTNWKLMGRYGDSGWELRPAISEETILGEKVVSNQGASLDDSTGGGATQDRHDTRNVVSKQSRFLAGFNRKRDIDKFMQAIGEY